MKSNKTEVLGFDGIEMNNCTWKTHSDDYYLGHEAGQQSKQDEIDRIVGIITEAYKSGGNSSVETVYDKIQELLNENLRNSFRE